jgi:hypothetical protein
MPVRSLQREVGEGGRVVGSESRPAGLDFSLETDWCRADKD